MNYTVLIYFSCCLQLQRGGGGILTGTVKIYNIYLGFKESDYKTPYLNSKSTSTAGIVEAFSSSVSDSAYANIHKTYVGAVPTTNFKFMGNSFYSNVPKKNVYSDADMDRYAKSAIAQEGWVVNATSDVFSVIFRGDMNYFSARSGKFNLN